MRVVAPRCRLSWAQRMATTLLAKSYLIYGSKPVKDYLAIVIVAPTANRLNRTRVSAIEVIEVGEIKSTVKALARYET
jgi:uncharacterized protein YfaQ (DUF2300 family)